MTDTEKAAPATHDHDHDHAHAHDHDDCGCGHDHHHHAAVETFVRQGPKVGRNDPCPCGSGKKYKKCCLAA
jgi:uncharacterized protein YecA (UPF0149 family)